MKLKKLYMSFICHFTLVAFISVISIEDSFLRRQRGYTEVSSHATAFNNNQNRVFEEKYDASDFIAYTHLLRDRAMPAAQTCFKMAPCTTVFFAVHRQYAIPIKIPLFIRLKALRV
jgi:hypothetical protein